MNKLKKLPFVLIIVSIIYIILEIMFRSNLLNVSATIQDNSEIIKLENVGRFLASFGFSIFIVSIIKIKKEYRNRTKFIMFISYPFIFCLAFYSFMQGQKILIEHIAQNINTQMKREMLLTSLVKEAIYFNKIPVKPIYDSTSKNDIDSKVFLSFFPSLIIGSDLTKQYEPEIDALVDITLTEKMLKNKDSSNKEVDKFIKDYIKNYQVALSNVKYGEKANFTGFKKQEIKIMLNYIATNMGIYALKNDIYNINKDNKFEKLNKDVHMKESISAIQNNLFKIKDGRNFNELFNSTMSDHMNFTFINHENYLELVDESFFNLVKDNDYSALLKYYSFGYDIRKQCKIEISEKNEINFYYGYNKNHILNIKTNTEENKLIFEELYKQITDRIPKEKYIIYCDYSYNQYVGLLTRIEKYFKYVGVVHNKDKFSLKTLNKNTINSNYYYRRMALNLMIEFIYDNTGKHIIKKFDNLNEFESFKNSIIFTDSNFYSSINKFMVNKYIKEFNKRAIEDGLNFNKLLRMDIQLDIPSHFYESKEVIETFKKGMPFIINEENKFFNNINELSESKKNGLRLYYVEHKKKIYTEILLNTRLLEEGEKYEKLGNDIAKGFIAPIFVLSISNIMIILSIINIFIKIIQVLEIKYTRIIQILLIISLICIPYYTKNRYSEHPLFEKYPNKSMLNILNWTQNTEYLLNNLDNDLIFFESIYSMIEKVTEEKEKRR